MAVITEANLPDDRKVVSSLYSSGIKNNLYIGVKDQKTAKDNQQIVFNFIKIVLNKTKDFEMITEETLESKNFLYMLKIFATSKEFFAPIDIVNIKLPAVLSPLIKKLSMIITKIIQFVDLDTAKMFSDLLHTNQVLQKQHEHVLYRKTMKADDESIVACMKITTRFISEKKGIISTQLLILDTILSKSLIQFSRKSCEQIVNVFMGVLQNVKAASSEYNYWSCCTSFRQHIHISVFVCVLRLLLSHLKAEPALELSEDFKDNVGSITDYFLDTIKKFQCPSFKNELRAIYTTFFEISNTVKCASNAQFVIFLFQDIFGNEKCQNEFYAPEEVRSFIMLCSKVDTELVKESTFLEELNALYVGHLLKSNNTKEKIREKICKYYRDTKPTSTILESIEKNKSHRKPINFDVEMLRREERDICMKWFKHMIPKLADSSISDLDYVIVAMQDKDKDIADNDKISQIYKRTLKELCEQDLKYEAKAEKFLTLAYITKIEVFSQIEVLRGEFTYLFLELFVAQIFISAAVLPT